MIKFENVSKIYENGFRAINNLNLEIKDSELLVLIGPSGCGKTTTMKMINRLIDSTSGTITINEKNIKSTDPVTLRRGIGYVIQHIGLFPHMTIEQNINLVPRLIKKTPEDFNQSVDGLLNMVGLDPITYKHKYPAQLSGGQQQRIGVIRAMAANPPIILMDEPFSALDPISREQLQDELVNLQGNIKKTIVFVTHDMDEAIKIADRICIMRDGEIVQLDTPEKILRHPSNDFVREFIGEERLKKAGHINLPSVSEIMTKAVTINENKKFAESAQKLHRKRVDHLIVTSPTGIYKGVASAWDLYKEFDHEEMTVSDILRVKPTMNVHDDLENALNIMTEHKMNFLPVLDNDNKVIGVITSATIVESLVSHVID